MDAQLLFLGGLSAGVIIGWLLAVFVYPGQ
jgi:hypothetical protein